MFLNEQKVIFLHEVKWFCPVGRVCTNGPEDQGSVQGRVILKT